MPASRHERFVLVLGLVLGAVAGCADGTHSGVSPVAFSADAAVPDGACTRIDEGCFCAAASPMDCYLDPTTLPDGSLMCHRGTRYCRDGLWTGCESVQDYSFDTSTALISGPDICNPCDPRCFVTTTTPTTGDLGTSTTVVYDPAAGGIVIAPAPPGGPPSADSDGDGVPDVADGCVGPGVAPNPDGSCDGNFIYRSLPAGSPSNTTRVTWNTTIVTADIYFLLDTSSGMDGELSHLSTEMTSGTYGACAGGVLGALFCAYPDAVFGVGYHEDYPHCPDATSCYGTSAATPYAHVLDMTTDTAAVAAAIAGLSTHDASDNPDSAIPAFFAAVNGTALGTYTSARAGTCPLDGWGVPGWGWPCFRSETTPIIVHVTDSQYHNGPGGAYPYCLGTGAILPLPTPTATAGGERTTSATDLGDVTGRWIGVTGSTSSARDDISSGCGENNARDVVYSFTLSAGQRTRITLEGSTYDTVMRLTDAAGTLSVCNDDYNWPTAAWSYIERDLPAGTYYVVIDGYSNSSGNYQLSVGTPVSCSGATHEPPTFNDAASALSDRGVRVVTINTCGSSTDPSCVEGVSSGDALAGATGSPAVTSTAADGTGLSAAIVSAVAAAAGSTTMDISMRPSGDIYGFVTATTPRTFSPRTGCAGIVGSYFDDCYGNTDVQFDVTMRNPGAPPGVYTFWMEVIGDGTRVLDRIAVRIIVPGMTGIYEPEGRYWQDYDSTLRCAITERPDWGTLTWNADIPIGTSLGFELQASDVLADLPTATPIATYSTTTSGAGSLDIAALLASAGISTNYRYLRVTAVLRANASASATPTLYSMAVAYTCIPSE